MTATTEHKLLIILNWLVITILILLLFTVWVGNYTHNQIMHEENKEDVEILKDILTEMKEHNEQEIIIEIPCND